MLVGSHFQSEVSVWEPPVHSRLLKCCQAHGCPRGSRFQLCSGRREEDAHHLEARAARRGGLGLGGGPHPAAARLPDGEGPGPLARKRAGSPPRAWAPAGRPGAPADSPRGGPASPAHAAKARPEQMGPSCWPGPGALPAPGGGWRGSSGRSRCPPGVAKARGSEEGTPASEGPHLRFAAWPWPRGELTPRSFVAPVKYAWF